MDAVDVEGGTVIEVPVSYTDLQDTEGQAFVLQEAEDESEEEVDSDPDFDPNDLDFEVEEFQLIIEFNLCYFRPKRQLI